MFPRCGKRVPAGWHKAKRTVKLPDASNPVPCSLLRSRPAIAAQLGELCCQWSAFEAYLAAMFAHLLLASPLVGDEILENIFDSSKKRAAIVNVANYRVKNTDDRAALIILLDEYQRLATQRSKYVHGRWMVEDKLFPDDAILIRKVNPKWSEQAELVSEKTLSDLCGQIVQLGEKFTALVSEDFIARF